MANLRRRLHMMARALDADGHFLSGTTLAILAFWAIAFCGCVVTFEFIVFR